MRNSLFILLLIVCLFPSCKKETAKQPGTYSNGVFVLNEGNFMFGNADVSFYNPTTNTVSNGLFKAGNNFSLGDVAQSMMLNDSVAYIAVNNSAKIEVVGLNDFKKTATINIPGSSPRYITKVSNEFAYVTELYAGKIWRLNLNTNTVQDFVTTNTWTEQMELVGSKLFVASRAKPNSSIPANKLLVINTSTNTIEQEIDLPTAPNSIAKDKDNNIWICCESSGTYNASILKLNSSSMNLQTLFQFTTNINAPSRLCINGAKDELYFIDTHIFKMKILENTPTVLINNSSQNFYALAIDPNNGDVYTSDAKEFVQKSTIFRYNRSGELLNTFDGGIISGNFTFSYE
jgi:hypothetical protein